MRVWGWDTSCLIFYLLLPFVVLENPLNPFMALQFTTQNFPQWGSTIFGFPTVSCCRARKYTIMFLVRQDCLCYADPFVYCVVSCWQCFYHIFTGYLHWKSGCIMSLIGPWWLLRYRYEYISQIASSFVIDFPFEIIVGCLGVRCINDT